MRPIYKMLALSLSMSAGVAHAAGDPAHGAVLAKDCLGCHGIAGYVNVYPTYHVPKLGGQHAAYIVSALKAYANGQRNHPTMISQAADMSDQDMADIAAYFQQAKKEK